LYIAQYNLPLVGNSNGGSGGIGDMAGSKSRGSMGSIAKMAGSDSRGSNGVGSIANVGHVGHGSLYGHVMSIDDGGLDDGLDRVDLVGLGHGIRLGYLDGVGLGNVLLIDDLSLDRDGDSDRDLDGVFVYLKLGFDTSHCGSNDSVGPDGSSDFLDSDGISRSGSLVCGCGGDGSVGSRDSGDGRGGNGDSVLGGLGGLSHIGVGGSLADRCVLAV